MDDMTLAAMLKEGAPPAQDWRFTLSVMARIEKRQFQASLVRNIGLGVGATALLALCAPALGGVLQGLAAPLSNDLIVAGLLLAGSALAFPWLARQI